jgi:FkbM family methyltransferase
MLIQSKKYQELRPGLDTLRHLFVYGLLTLLAKQVTRRPQRLFVELASNIDRHVLADGVFEKGVIDLLRDVCTSTRRTALMIDVGANIGNHTVALANLFEGVESVEPHPILFRVLQANVLRNGHSHVRCHNFGLAGENARGTLTESVDNHALNRVRERSQLPPEVFGLSAEKFGKEYAIELRSAEEFIGGYADRLDRAFIKIDVEGMEEEILVALLPLLEKHKPLVGFEWFTRAQPRIAALVSALQGYEVWGIRMHDVGGGRLWRACKMIFRGRSYTLERIDTSKLDEVYPLALLVPKGG